MKKIIALLLAAAMILPLSLSLIACNNDPGGEVNPPETEKYAYDVDLPTEIPNFGEDAIMIHYQRSDGKYASWALWLWDPEGEDDNQIDEFNYMDDYGVIAVYPLSHFGELSGNRLGMIVRKRDSWTKDGGDADRFAELNRMTKDENGFYHVYLVGGDEHVYLTPEKVIPEEIKAASFLDGDTISVSTTVAVDSLEVFCDGVKLGDYNGAGRQALTADLPKDHEVRFDSEYTVRVTFRGSGQVLTATVGKTGLFKTDAFNEQYYYDGELGALWTESATEFKVWSPIASAITLRIYENGTPVSVSSSKGSDAFSAYEMVKGDKGVWSVSVDGNLEGKYYTYVVKTSAYPDGKEIVDPYAKSAGVNGLRGMIVDFSKTNPAGWESIDYLAIGRNELTVYETHVADVTSDDSWGGDPSNAKKYLGLIEKGTTYSENGVTVKTGFDHILELGVNAVQLLPIFDQANNEVSTPFNWGYNPLNYNVAEGCYASDPYDGYVRIRELKDVVMAFRNEGIITIMDVVYNHVNGAAGSNWDVLMPGYYYRYTSSGALSNGSGCGNEVASENLMVRKFIIDSVTFWMKEYKLGGFRFDLMGLHDIETMNLLAASLKEINPYAVVYGEPWTGGTTTLSSSDSAKQSNAKNFVGYGQFNDQMRDALIKGGLSGPSEKGWITNVTSVSTADVNAITEGINGATHNATDDPNKTVNYVTCHDNYTLYDCIKAAGITDEETIRKMALLANSVVFTSCGTTFMLSGEEFLRTKSGNSNSYNASYELNALDYSLKIKNSHIFEAYVQLIRFKQSVSELHSEHPSIAVEKLENGAVLRYTLHDETSGKTYLVIHSNGASSGAEIEVGEGYSVWFDSTGLGIHEGKITAAPLRTVILVQD